MELKPSLVPVAAPELESKRDRVESENEDAIASVVAAALRGQTPSPRRLQSALDQAAFFEVADAYGVGPLLRRNLKESGAWSQLPDAVTAGLDALARREVGFEAQRFRETRRVVAAFSEAGVEYLVLKGTALAYTHYPAAYLRPRVDTDLFIRKSDRSLATEVLLDSLHYQRANSVSRDAVHAQWMFKRREGPLVHLVDLHWSISNPQLFRGMLSFDELLADAMPIEPLGTGARAPAPVHALLLACIHRVAHHDDSQNPLWLYDIKLLADGLSPTAWDRFWELAARKQIVKLCAEGLAQATRQLGCFAPNAPRVLSSTEGGRGAEASAGYLGGVGNGLRSLLLDLKNAGGTEAMVRLLAGHAFPTPTYMRSAYGATGRISLATAYVRRATRVLWRLIASNDATSSSGADRQQRDRGENASDIR